MVTALLGSAAWVERLGTATANREDLGRFQVVAWTDSINQLPPEKALLIEELDDRMEEDDGLVLPGDALIPLEKLMLRYVVKIRLVRVEDMAAPDPAPGNGGDDDGGGLGSGDRGRFGRSGRPSQGPEARQDARGPCLGLHDEHGDEARRRRNSGASWGGCRRVAINAPLEVEPWPAVEEENPEEEDGRGVGVVARLDRSSSESETLRSSTPVSASSFDQEMDLVVDQAVDQPRGVPIVVEEAPLTSLNEREETAPSPLLSAAAREVSTAFQTRDEGAGESIGSEARDDADARDASVGPVFVEVPVFTPANCQLASPGLLPSPGGGFISGCWSPELDKGGSPRSVLDRFDAFSVYLSLVDVGSKQQRGPEAVVPAATPVVACSPASFHDSCKKLINSVLSRPVAKRCRNKRKYTGPVRRSGLIRCFATGTPIRQQQQLTLITRLGITREGEGSPGRAR